MNDTLRELAACLRQLEEARLELGSSAVPEKNLFNPTQFDRTEIIRDGDRPLLLSVGPHASSPQRTARVLSPDGDTSLPQTFTNGFYSARIDAEGFIASLKVDGDAVELGGYQWELKLADGDLTLYWRNFAAAPLETAANLAPSEADLIGWSESRNHQGFLA